MVDTKNAEGNTRNSKIIYTEAQGHCVKSMMFTIENILRKSTNKTSV